MVVSVRGTARLFSDRGTVVDVVSSSSFRSCICVLVPLLYRPLDLVAAGLFSRTLNSIALSIWLSRFGVIPVRVVATGFVVLIKVEWAGRWVVCSIVVVICLGLTIGGGSIGRRLAQPCIRLSSGAVVD